MNKPTTWIILRGLIRGKQYWGDFVDHLKKNFPDNNFITLDVPGNGELYKMASPIKIEDYAKYLHHKKIEMNIQGPVILMGHSMGAMIALAWEKLYPEEITGLVLMNASAGGINPVFHRFHPRNLHLIFRFTFACLETRERLLLDCISNDTNKKREHLQGWIDIQKKYPVSRMNMIRQIWASFIFSFSKLTRPKPVFLITSKKDGLADYRCSLELQKAIGSTAALALHDSAGHDTVFDDQAWVIGKLSKWLESH